MAVPWKPAADLGTLTDVERWIDAELDGIPHKAPIRGAPYYTADGAELARWIFDNERPSDLALARARIDWTLELLPRLREALSDGS